MAKFIINSVGKNRLVLSYASVDPDNFYTKLLDRLKKNEDESVTISYSAFTEVFLSNKNNYNIYKITREKDGDNYIITMHYNYIENKNGVHIFAPSVNTFIVKQSVLDETGLNNIINFEKESLEVIEQSVLNKMNEEKVKIYDIEHRIRPNVEEILSDFFDIGLSIDFNRYDISKQEFIEYIKNNPLYIRKYIMEYSYHISTALKTSAVCSALFSIEIIVTLVTKNVTLLSYISYVLFTLSVTGGVVSLALIEKGLNEIKKCEPNSESILLRRRKE